MKSLQPWQVFVERMAQPVPNVEASGFSVNNYLAWSILDLEASDDSRDLHTS